MPSERDLEDAIRRSFAKEPVDPYDDVPEDDEDDELEVDDDDEDALDELEF